MRLTRNVAWIVGALLAAPIGGGWSLIAPSAAQAQVLLPDESAKKAQELIQQTIQKLGGQKYLNVRDSTCSGRFATFDRKEELGGYARFIDYVKLPDKNRTEFYKKRNIIQVRTSTDAWDLDRGGVTEAPPDVVDNYNEGLKADMDILLRLRLNKEDLVFRYGGSDLVDLKRVDWVEIVDSGQRTARIAIDKNSHLPLRAVFITRDPYTRERIEEATFFSNWHPVEGVMTPFQVWHERNGRATLRIYFEECKYNTGLDDSLFTKESLEQRFAELK